ncbi:DNA repair exonuclease [Enterococcus saccharolyticus]|uniref:Metallophosphoesterase n=1 Tax=Candidatus Enterococcus willemsii TaxID=1857215 RepID=A0ABQ6Z0M8_9ENTE|nr:MULTISPECIES: DNA repair exonuclease [Enterococcus]KAF1304585.1 metallophosphoesterase [Enterococcus sp. CU12B]MCD5001320.1 DNA repair exonuclease [Enterococcus saccharolyticus]
MLRFIHCADLHFDRSFEGLHLVANRVRELALANEQVLENIVSLALSEQVDFLLLAGDTFHQNRPSLKTQHLFFQQMNRLKEKNIPVYMSFGNHDFYEKERYWFDFPDNIYLFQEEAVTTVEGKTATGETYAISGFSYHHPWITTSKVNEYPNRQATYHIGMYHGDMQGNYAPFRVQEMKQKGYDYWALGHIHVPTQLAVEPPIIYAGAPQGHTQKETQIQGVLLVSLGETVEITPKSVAAITWETVTVSLKAIRDQRTALEKIQQTFLASEKKLIHLKLVDTEGLPTQWLNEKEKPEIIAYLNDNFARKGWEQMIYQLTDQATSEETKLLLSGKEVVKQLLESYQEEAVFQSIVDELATHPLVKRTLSLDELKQETLEQVKEIFTYEFRWSEEEK